MERIEGQIDDLATLAKQTLSWIAYAKRPLTTLELRHALAVEVGETSLVDSNMSHVEDVVSVCAGLITVDYKSDTISFVHYTTQQYFERTRNYWFPSSEASITDICITYLSFSIFDNKFYENVDQVGKRVESNPFYDYAVRNWGHHARSASTPVQSVMQFLNNNTLFKSSSQALIVLERHRQLPYKDGPAYMTGLHLAAYFGIQEVVNALLSCGHDPDSADSVGRTPLSWAAGNGHKGVVELLLKQQGVKPDSVALTAQTASRFYDRKGSGQTPLSYAAKNGHREVVKLLLDHIDVNPNYGAKARGDKNYGRTPLSFAAGYGHKEVVELLLSRTGVEPDSSASGSQRGGSGRTPLSYAAEYGHTSIVKILLAQPGVDPDSETTSERVGGRTPLSYAAEGGHQAVVELLLAQPLVNPLSMATGENDYQNREWNIGTPLSLAQKRGHESIVRLIQSALPSRV